jgi:hypothetical protein
MGDDNLREQLESAMGAAGDDPPSAAPAVSDPPGEGAPPAAGEPPAGTDPNAAAVQQALAALEIPGNFPHAYRTHLEALAGDATQRARAEAWLKHHGETEKFIGQLKQNYGALRQNFEPIHQVLAPFMEGWQRNGIAPQQGLQQVMAWGQMIAQDPQRGLTELAKYYNVDLAKVVEQQPYVDPAVSGELNALRQQVQQMVQHQRGSAMQSMAQQQNAVVQHIRAFESETDASGQPKYPHFQRLADKMSQAINAGFASDLPSAYEFASRNDADLQREMGEAAKRNEAAKRAADAQRAAAASRQVSGKGGAGNPPAKTLREELEANLRAQSA